MDAKRYKRHALLSWLFVAVVGVLFATLGALQYRWIGEVSQAERERLRGNLQASLQRLSEDFDSEIAAAVAALTPPGDPNGPDREEAYTARYIQWRDSARHKGLFRRIGIAVPEDGGVTLRLLDLNKAVFAKADWPESWSELHRRIEARVSPDPERRFRPFGQPNASALTAFEIPRFVRFGGGPGVGPGRGGRRFSREQFRSPDGEPRRPEPLRELDWLVLEPDVDSLRETLVPELVQRHLEGSGKLDYQVQVVTRATPAAVIYQSDPGMSDRIGLHADASVGLFGYQGGPRGDGPRGGFGRGGRGPGSPPGQAGFEPGRWLLSVRHRAGSLEAAVDQARFRNLAVTGGILILLLATIAALVRFTRRAQVLAELQMEFVAGVSHELRTPLSVIRTAAHNLGGGVIAGDRVQRYGALIERESERLTAIVEQVLLFSNAEAGRVTGAKEVVTLDYVIDEALESSKKAVEESRCILEKSIEEGLPPVMADPTALKHALLNLVTNAAKYGAEGGWIGVFAKSVAAPEGPLVEIRVADRGPGIPPKELDHIFDAFYRGKRAVEDQIHGTGLGLSLVKRIIEAHGGTVTAQSELGNGTEFVARIPAAPADKIDEFADTTNRR